MFTNKVSTSLSMLGPNTKVQIPTQVSFSSCLNGFPEQCGSSGGSSFNFDVSEDFILFCPDCVLFLFQ